MDNKELIIDKAFEIGFHQIGFGKARRFDELEKIYKNRKFLEFESNDIEKKINPFVHFKDAKTFIALGLSYDLSNDDHIYDDEIKVASSRIKDYHIVMREMLEELLNYTEKLLNCSGKTFVDIEGFSDRKVASECGIGYYGKNENIISYYLGTNFNIGYLMIDFGIDADKVILDDCKDCMICYKACPSGAIKGDYTIDANKCISYLTQKKEELSQDEELYIKECIYGCDVCQLVCPKNIVLHKRNEDLIFKTNEMISLSNKEFKKRYYDRDFSWRGYSIIKRNIKLSIENRKL